MVPVARPDELHERLAERRQSGRLALTLQQRAHGLHLGRRVDAPAGLVELGAHRVGQVRRQRHAPAVPARHDAPLRPRRAHRCGHLPQTHQLQHAPGEDEPIARPQAGDEGLLDRAERAPVGEPDLDRAVGDDGADAHPVPALDALRGDAPGTVRRVADARVVRVGAERRAAGAHERRRPRPLRVADPAERPRREDLPPRLGLRHPQPGRQRDEVLHEHVHRPLDRGPRLDPARVHRLAGRRELDELQRVRRDADDAARPRPAGDPSARPAASGAPRPWATRPGSPGPPAGSRRRGRGSTCTPRTAGGTRPRARRGGARRPRGSPGRASRGASRSRRRGPDDGAGSPRTRSPPARACW